jgi:hypothetical protein
MTMLRRIGAAGTDLCALALAGIALLLLAGRRVAAVVGTILFVILLPGLAAAADSSSTITDIAPLLNQIVFPAVISLLGILGGYVLLWVKKRMGMAADDQNAGKLEDAMKFGLAFAQSQLQAQASGPLNIDLKSPILTVAAKYAMDHAPDAMKALGVGEDLLRQKLEARLSLNTTPPEKSVAVPTPPAPSAPAVATAITAQAG